MDKYLSDRRSHISCQFSHEMLHKWLVYYIMHFTAYRLSCYIHTYVPLDVQLHNENKMDEMCAIMNNIHKYVSKATHEVTCQGESMVINEDFFHGIIFHGNQLTICQSRDAKVA